MTKQETKQDEPLDLISIILDGTIEERRAIFEFDNDTSEEELLLKFNLWSRYYFPSEHEDADFHEEMDLYTFRAYSFDGGDDPDDIKYFINAAFRGAAKTTRTKKIVTFCIANDQSHHRRYIKVLAKRIKNSKQFVTDIHNYLVRIEDDYPEIFAPRTGDGEKKQRAMSAFVTETGVKVEAGTVGTDHRGDVIEEARPDLIILDDFETEETLSSAVETHTIKLNMEEARTGLSKNGACIYLCNYKSERGNVHEIMTRGFSNKKVLIVPIIKDPEYDAQGTVIGGKPAWIYTLADVQRIQKDTLDFAGEYLQDPSAGSDTYFPRHRTSTWRTFDPIRRVGEFKIFYDYVPGHAYGSGHDVAKGVKKDSSTSVFIDFSSVPARVVATYKNNEIKPTAFGSEIVYQANHFGKPVVAPETNIETAVIEQIKRMGYTNIYQPMTKTVLIESNEKEEYGWHTNRISKPFMMNELYLAIENGELEVPDEELVWEIEGYTQHDLMDREVDPRLTTRHFDLLIALAIAWQTRHQARPTVINESEGSSTTYIKADDLEAY